MKTLHISISLLVLAGAVLLSADDKKTTKPPPPPRKAAVTKAAPAVSAPPTRTNPAPAVKPPASVSTPPPSTGQPSGKRVYSPTVTTPPPSTGQPTGKRVYSPTVTTPPPSTGQPTGKRVYNPTVAAPPPTGSGGPITHLPTKPLPNSGKPTIYQPPVGVTRGSNGRLATFRSPNGNQARFGADGHVRSVHTHDMTIVHPPNGGRQVVVERMDHTRIVTNGAGHGYVQKPFTYRGHEYASRTYYYNGRPYVHYYRSYTYRGVYLVGYTPVRYYSPVFYGWAYHPWGRPVVYAWGWGGSPWYGYYGGYFAPYPNYPSASFWLTDYIIATNLQLAYQQQLDAQAQMQPAYGGGPVALTPEVKQAIADEVQRQLALENSEGQQAARNVDTDPQSSGLPRMLADGESHVFVASNALDVTDAQGQSCVVTEGDVLQLQTPPPQDASAGFLNVLASKGQDCPKGDVVTIAFSDLQEMQNNMRAGIDGGLQQLQQQAGQQGLPQAPPGANAAPVQSAFAPIAPPPDPNVSGELGQQAQASNQAEQQVISEAGAAGGSQ